MGAIDQHRHASRKEEGEGAEGRSRGRDTGIAGCGLDRGRDDGALLGHAEVKSTYAATVVNNIDRSLRWHFPRPSA